MVTHGGVIREFTRYFRDRLRCVLPDQEPMRVTPNTGVNVFKLVYVNQVLKIAECLKMHETSHLNGMSDDQTGADVAQLPDKPSAVGNGTTDNQQRPDIVPLEAL